MCECSCTLTCITIFFSFCWYIQKNQSKSHLYGAISYFIRLIYKLKIQIIRRHFIVSLISFIAYTHTHTETLWKNCRNLLYNYQSKKIKKKKIHTKMIRQIKLSSSYKSHVILGQMHCRKKILSMMIGDHYFFHCYRWWASSFLPE